MVRSSVSLATGPQRLLASGYFWSVVPSLGSHTIHHSGFCSRGTGICYRYREPLCKKKKKKPRTSVDLLWVPCGFANTIAIYYISLVRACVYTSAGCQRRWCSITKILDESKRRKTWVTYLYFAGTRVSRVQIWRWPLEVTSYRCNLQLKWIYRKLRS